jgi:hypothetical protein
MKVLQYEGRTAVVEVFLAPGVVSPEAIQPLTEKFEIMLAEVSDKSNVFLKRLYRRGDYFAVIAIEDAAFADVVWIASQIEKKTRMVSSLVRNSVNSAIERMV